MKKIVFFSVLIIITSGSLLPQDLLRNFGDNHVTASSIAFTSEGRLMIAGGYCKIYDLSTGKLDFRTLPKDSETLDDYSSDVVISPDDNNFIIAKLNRLELWDLRNRTIKKKIKDNKLVPTAACFSTDGSNIIYMRKNGEVIFVNSVTYSETLAGKVTGDEPTVITLSPDGRNLLIGNRGNEIITFSLDKRITTRTMIDSRDIYKIRFSPDGFYLAASSSNGRIWLGHYPSMETVRSWQAHSEGKSAIFFHPSGKYLASGGKDKFICIWSIPDCNITAKWEGHKAPVEAVAFSPSGRELASGSLNAVIKRGGDDLKVWSFTDPSAEIYSKKVNTITPPVGKNVPVITQAGTSARKRIALVIGNGNYISSVLANPENDAREIRNVLMQYGFDVMEYENLDQARIKQAIDEFGRRLKNYDVGLFFYAGHGIQSRGYNYLIPVDAVLDSEEKVEYDCVQADRVLAVMEASGTMVNIMILDACRNNPFERSWTRAVSGRGLAYMNAPSGTLIAYATAPGSTASDGSGKNGLYTSAILESIRIPNITILQMFQNVRAIVSQKSGKQQIPWESTSLTGDFYFYQENK
jgi:hypothetical protein